MAGTRDVLGSLTCPWCASTKGCSVRLSAKGLAYVVHECCQMQSFARSGKSDQLIRDRTRAVPAVDADKPAPAAAAAAPAAPPAAPAKGIFGW